MLKRNYQYIIRINLVVTFVCTADFLTNRYFNQYDLSFVKIAEQIAIIALAAILAAIIAKVVNKVIERKLENAEQGEKN